MADVAFTGSIPVASSKGPKLDSGFHPMAGIAFFGIIAAALLYVGYSIYVDVEATGVKVTTYRSE